MLRPMHSIHVSERIPQLSQCESLDHTVPDRAVGQPLASGLCAQGRYREGCGARRPWLRDRGGASYGRSLQRHQRHVCLYGLHDGFHSGCMLFNSIYNPSQGAKVTEF